MVVQETQVSNTHLPKVQVQTEEKSSHHGLLKRAADLWQSAWPIQLWNYNVNPTPCPDDTLKRTAQAAERSLDYAYAGNIPVPPITARLHGAIDQALRTRAKIKTTATSEQVPRNIIDPDVTLVPHLRKHVENVDWKEQIRVNQIRLTEKLSAYTILLRMRSHIGTDDLDNLKLMNLVKLHTEGKTQKSLWTLFTDQYDLSFFQTAKALMVYWFYYMTSLITNTIDAYLGSFIESTTEELTKEHSNARSMFLQGTLRNINQFFVGDIQASKAFSEGKDHGDLDDYRDREIERHYGFSLSELCRAFSEKRVEESPRVRFFKDLQELPILGWFFEGIEWLLNQFIIRSNMRTWILPGVMESAVNKGLEATQPHNIPFSLSMTRFITSQLEELYDIIQQEEDPSADIGETKPLPGTELMGATIKNLKTVLALESCETSLELRKKFEELEKGDFLVKKQVAEAIEQGINDAAHLLFNYLNEGVKSGELFARMLELSCEPFTGEVSNQEDLMAEYTEEQQKLERTARVAFGALVQQSVSKFFRSQGSSSLAMNSSRRQKCVSQKVVEEMNRVCLNISEKIQAEAEHPSAENNVQADIGEFLQILQVFASRKEFQEKTNGVYPLHQNEIWRVFSPIFEKVKDLQQRATRLQTYQHYYTSHAAVEENLKEIKELLQAITEHFEAQPRHLKNPLLQTLNKHIDESVHLLGRDAPVSDYLTSLSQNLTNQLRTVSKKQQSLDAIEEIYRAPSQPARPDQEIDQGILNQIIACEQGNPPPNFRLTHSIKQLRESFERLPDVPGRVEIQELIGNGRNLSPKIHDISRLIKNMYQRINRSKYQSLIALNTSIAEAIREIHQKMTNYRDIKEQNYQSSKAEMNIIQRDLQKLSRLIEDVEPSFSNSSRWAKYFGGGLALAGSAIGGWTGGVLGLLGGGACTAPYRK